jgi:hypothetical protein
MNRAVVIAAAVAAVTCGGTRAGNVQPPTSFVPNAALSKAESFVAGKPVTSYCAPTQAALAALVDPSFAGVGQTTQGATPIGGSWSGFSPTVCNFTRLWNSGKLVTRKPVNLLTVASAILTVAHEGELAKGISDETDADCAALSELPQLVARFFPLHKRETMHAFMADAWEIHGLSPSIYHSHAC